MKPENIIKLETRQKAREEALKNAVKAARTDADILASALDVRITGTVQASTSGGSLTSPAPYMEYAVAESIRSTPITPGDVSVSAYVTVTYQFE
ncbi:MAG: SIMPL domain-containing protein [Methanosarcinales archaeon]|nr:SIMPL domain-containing protein [Methanosarcinales archaeon]